MKTSKILGFAGVVLLLIVLANVIFADISTQYFGTIYKRFLVLRNDTTATGINATTPDRVYDGAFTATPISMSQEEVLIYGDLQLQFRDGNQFIHSDGATSLLIDGNADLKLTGTAITMSGVVSCGNFITTGGGSSAINDIPIGAGTPDTGAFTTLACTTIAASGAAQLSSTLKAEGNVSFDGGTFIYNETGADLDARFEGDTAVNLLFLDASADKIGINTNTPSHTLDIVGTLEVSGVSVLTGAITATGGLVGDVTGDLEGDVTSSGTSAFTVVTISSTTTMSGDLSLSSADILMKSGNAIDFDDDADVTGFISNADNNLSFLIGGTNEITLNNTYFYPSTNLGLSLGNPSYAWNYLYVANIETATLDVSTTSQFDGVATLTSGFNSDGNSDFDDLVTISDLLAFNGTPQDMTTTAAENVVNATTTITMIRTGGAHAITIADGVTEGQLKIIKMYSDGGDGTLAGANLVGTSLVFDDVGESAILGWDEVNGVWYVWAVNGATYTA